MKQTPIQEEIQNLRQALHQLVEIVMDLVQRNIIERNDWVRDFKQHVESIEKRLREKEKIWKETSAAPLK